MGLARIPLPVSDRPALQALHEQQLSKGRAFVPGAGGVEALQACVLVVQHAGREHELAAEAVFVKAEGPGAGVGLQLRPLDPAQAQALRAFVEDERAAAEHETETANANANATETANEAEREEGASPAAGLASPSVLERVRGLSHAEQQRLAANGSMPERIALERAVGAHVWEALLTNPRLTIPEVARIARKGTLPRPLVENIAGHASWVAAPEVQRALLGNPCSSAAIIGKVLASMTRADLVLVPQQTAYPQSVRMQARRLLGGAK